MPPKAVITGQQIRDLATQTRKEGSGVIIITHIDGTTSIGVINNGSLSNGNISLFITYGTGYTGPTTVVYKITGLS